MLDARSNNYAFIMRRPHKAIVSAVTLVAFLFNIFVYDIAWAADTSVELTSVGSGSAGGPGSTRDLNVGTFKLPEYLGQIRDAWASPRQLGTIIHIQDAHCNYAAQHKIAEIVEYLNKEYGIRAVNLEGGVKGYDLSIFTNITDKDVRERVADYFVKEGLVNGAEYFAINNPEKVSLWGIEEARLYLDNLGVYTASLVHKDEIDKDLKNLGYILTMLKVKIYSRELLEFDMKYSQYKANNVEFKDYLDYLIRTAKARALDVKSFGNIYLLSQAFEEESKIDFQKATAERDGLIDRLQKKLSRKSMEELVMKTVEFKTEKMSQRDFYAYLIAKAKIVNVDIKDFPELEKYIVYVSIYDAMDKSRVMDEIDKLETLIKEAMYRSDKERELAALSKNLAILKNIFGISLTRNDYRYYEENKDVFSMANYVTFINREAPLYKVAATLNDDIGNIDGYREDMAKFYDYSFKRDEAFIKNIRSEAPATGAEGPRGNIGIVVTGGFHTENLCDMFKKEGISYISITPNFKSPAGYDSPYFALLAGKTKGLVEKLAPVIAASSSMQLFSMLVSNRKLADEVWGKDKVQAFNAAVYVQSLIEQGKRVQITKDGNILFDSKAGTVVESITVADMRAMLAARAMSVTIPAVTAPVVAKPTGPPIVSALKHYGLDEGEAAEQLSKMLNTTEGRAGVFENSDNVELAKGDQAKVEALAAQIPGVEYIRIMRPKPKIRQILGNVPAVHYIEGNILTIVLNGNILPEGLFFEAAYHEVREAFWLSDANKEFIDNLIAELKSRRAPEGNLEFEGERIDAQRIAHIIASNEQGVVFGKAYANMEIFGIRGKGGMSAELVGKLLGEWEKYGKRPFHEAILLAAKKELGAEVDLRVEELVKDMLLARQNELSATPMLESPRGEPFKVVKLGKPVIGKPATDMARRKMSPEDAMRKFNELKEEEPLHKLLDKGRAGEEALGIIIEYVKGKGLHEIEDPVLREKVIRCVLSSEGRAKLKDAQRAVLWDCVLGWEPSTAEQFIEQVAEVKSIMYPNPEVLVRRESFGEHKVPVPKSFMLGDKKVVFTGYIDEGVEGAVFKAEMEGVGPVAVKVRKVPGQGRTESQKLSRSFQTKNILQEDLNCERLSGEKNIIRTYGRASYIIKGVQRGEYACIVQELFPKTLWDDLQEHIRDGRFYPEKQVRDVLGKGLFTGLANTHKAHLIHYDVKPQNAFINSAGELITGDFGTAGHFSPESGKVLGRNFLGNPQYAPTRSMNKVAVEGRPNGVVEFSPETDLWSAACVLYELIHNGMLPWSSSVHVSNKQFEDIMRAGTATDKDKTPANFQKFIELKNKIHKTIMEDTNATLLERRLLRRIFEGYIKTAEEALEEMTRLAELDNKPGTPRGDALAFAGKGEFARAMELLNKELTSASAQKDMEFKEIIEATLAEVRRMERSVALVAVPGAGAAVSTVEGWEYIRPDNFLTTYKLDWDNTIPAVLKMLEGRPDIKREIKERPAILVKLFLVYQTSTGAAKEKTAAVENYIKMLDKTKEVELKKLTPRELEEGKKRQVKGSSLSVFFDKVSGKPIRGSKPQSLSIIPYIDYAFENGIENVEIPLDFQAFDTFWRLGGEYSDEELELIKAYAEERGITITIHSPIVGPDNIFMDPIDNIGLMKEQIRVAGKMGAKIFVVHLVDIGRGETEEYAKEKAKEYASLVDYAAEHAPGLKIGLENYSDKNKVFSATGEFMDFVTLIFNAVANKNKAALRNIAIVMDVAHINLANKEDPLGSPSIIDAGVRALIARKSLADLKLSKQDIFAEAHHNHNLGPIPFYGAKGKAFSADRHFNVSWPGPIHNTGIAAILGLLGYKKMNRTIEQKPALLEADMRVFTKADELTGGWIGANIRRMMGRVIIAVLQVVENIKARIENRRARDYKGFIHTQVASAKDYPAMFDAYCMFAGLMGMKEFTEHVERRVCQKLLTMTSPEKYDSVKKELQKYGFWDEEITTVTDRKIITQGQDVSTEDLKGLGWILYKSAWGVRNEVDKVTGEVKPVPIKLDEGDVFAEIALLEAIRSGRGKRTASIFLNEGAIAVWLPARLAIKMDKLLHLFIILGEYKEARDEATRLAISAAVVPPAAVVPAVTLPAAALVSVEPGPATPARVMPSYFDSIVGLAMFLAVPVSAMLWLGVSIAALSVVVLLINVLAHEWAHVVVSKLLGAKEARIVRTGWLPAVKTDWGDKAPANWKVALVKIAGPVSHIMLAVLAGVALLSMPAMHGVLNMFLDILFGTNVIAAVFTLVPLNRKLGPLAYETDDATAFWKLLFFKQYRERMRADIASRKAPASVELGKPAAPATGTHAGFGLDWADLTGRKTVEEVEQHNESLRAVLKEQENNKQPLRLDGFYPERTTVTINGKTATFDVQVNERWSIRLRGMSIGAFIEQCIRLRGPQYADALLKGLDGKLGADALIFDVVDSAPKPYGNCLKDGYLYVDGIVGSGLDMLGVSHELMHEAGIYGSEPEQEAALIAEDVIIIQSDEYPAVKNEMRAALADLIDRGGVDAASPLIMLMLPWLLLDPTSPVEYVVERLRFQKAQPLERPAVAPAAERGIRYFQTSEGRHRVEDAYIIGNLVNDKTKVVVDFGCGFPAVTVYELAQGLQAAGYGSAKVIGVDILIPDHVKIMTPADILAKMPAGATPSLRQSVEMFLESNSMDENGEAIPGSRVLILYDKNGNVLNVVMHQPLRIASGEIMNRYFSLTTSESDVEKVEAIKDAAGAVSPVARSEAEAIRDNIRANVDLVRNPSTTSLDVSSLVKAKVDIVKAMNVLSTVDEEVRKKQVDELGRCLKPSGLLVVGETGLATRGLEIYEKQADGSMKIKKMVSREELLATAAAPGVAAPARSLPTTEVWVSEGKVYFKNLETGKIMSELEIIDGKMYVTDLETGKRSELEKGQPLVVLEPRLDKIRKWIDRHDVGAVIDYDMLSKADKTKVFAALDRVSRAWINIQLFIKNDLAPQGDAGKEMRERSTAAEVARLQKQVFLAGSMFDIQAHGTGIGHVGLSNLLDIMLEGRVRSDSRNMGTLKDGDPAVMAGPHGPCYVVLNPGTKAKGWQEKENHAYYLVPESVDKDYLISMLKLAAERKKVSEDVVRSAINRIRTYKEFLDVLKSKPAEPVAGVSARITPVVEAPTVPIVPAPPLTWKSPGDNFVGYSITVEPANAEGTMVKLTMVAPKENGERELKTTGIVEAGKFAATKKALDDYADKTFNEVAAPGQWKREFARIFRGLANEMSPVEMAKVPALAVPVRGAEAKTGPLKEFEDFLEGNPEFKSPLAEEIKALLAGPDAKALWKAFSYNAGIYTAAKKVIEKTGAAETRYIFIPVSEKLCPINAGTLQAKMQMLWKSVRGTLDGEYRIGTVTVVFYREGTLASLKTEMDKRAGKLNPRNAVAYVDSSEVDANLTLYDTIKSVVTAVKDKAPAEGGYFSIGGHIALGIGMLELLNPDSEGSKDDAYFSLVRSLLNRLSYGLSYDVTKEAFMNMLKKGELKILLPPVTKIDIDKNMENFFMTEEAALKSL